MVPNGSAYADYPVFAGSGTKVKPSPDAKYAQGFLPGETLPAEWANYLFYGATGGVTRLNADTDSIKKELNSILTAYGITNNADAYNQVLTALNRIYPQICECSTAASTEVKSVVITGDGVILKAGNVYAITMTNGNTYGDGSSTYPKLSINSGTAKPLCDASGRYLKAGAWAAGDVITVLYTGTKFLMATASEDAIENGNQKAVTSNAVSCILAANTTVTGPRLGIGGNVKIMFTADISGADGTTPLTISYNGTSLAVKVCKNGAKAEVYAQEVSAGTFKFIQAYTTLEFVFDGTDLVIVGNPVVLSSSDYTIYADGSVGQYIPDWENATLVLSTAGTYTLLKDGFLSMECSGHDDYGVAVRLKSNATSSIEYLLGSAQGWSGHHTSSQGAFVQVNKGNIITSAVSGSYVLKIYFIPRKYI